MLSQYQGNLRFNQNVDDHITIQELSSFLSLPMSYLIFVESTLFWNRGAGYPSDPFVSLASSRFGAPMLYGNIFHNNIDNHATY